MAKPCQLKNLNLDPNLETLWSYKQNRECCMGEIKLETGDQPAKQHHIHPGIGTETMIHYPKNTDVDTIIM